MHEIMLVDDDAAIRKSLGLLLETYGFHVSAYDSVSKALKAHARKRPDCIVLDVRMPEMDGLAAQRLLAESEDAPPVIFITGHGDVAMAVTAMKNGAFDFVEKPVDDERLVAAITAAIDNAGHGSFRQLDRQALQKRYQTLTEREKAVARLVVDGYSTAAIASILEISPRTVDHHRARILAKMQATTLSQLMRHLLAVKL